MADPRFEHHTVTERLAAVADELDHRKDYIGANIVREGVDELERLEDVLRSRGTWSFDTLLYVADRLLTEFYPDDIFPDVPEEDAKGDPGPQLIRAIRRCRRALSKESVS